MIKSGILNPGINSLLSRVHHTNSLLIADRGFPNFPGIEIVDISLVPEIPRVVDVLRAILSNFSTKEGVMASEFREVNSSETLQAYDELLEGMTIKLESHTEFKKRVPAVIGIIRTGDTTRFGNILLVSC